MKKNPADISYEYLKQNPGKKLEAKELSKWIFLNHPEWCQKKKNRSKKTYSDKEFIQQISAEISELSRSKIKYPQIETTDDRPKKYYFTESTEIFKTHSGGGISTSTTPTPELKEDNSSQAPSKSKLLEKELYPILSKFLEKNLNVHSKRIEESRSQNKRGRGGNEWLYPDLVGLEDTSENWIREIKDCVQEYKDKQTRLWSFEVKISIDRSNIRSTFFQAISNSSWANFGYLVASVIKGNDTEKELRILSSLHGIGFILLNTEKLEESKIIIPAKERQQIDWDTANRLAEENSDFKKYIKYVYQFYRTGRIVLSDWD